jgi:hypothetical protein
MIKSLVYSHRPADLYNPVLLAAAAGRFRSACPRALAAPPSLAAPQTTSKAEGAPAMERIGQLAVQLQPRPAAAVAASSALAPTTPAADLGGCWLDAASYAAHRLTPAQRAQFAEQGWLMVDGALSAADIAALTAALDAVHDAKLREAADPSHPDAMNRMAIFTPANRLSNAEPVQRLLTCPAVFPKIVDILGWNIGVYHAHANISPPPVPGDVLRDGQFRPVGTTGGGSVEPQAGVHARPSSGREPTHGFHQDAARVNTELETANQITPRLSVKAAFYLNDVSLDNAPTWIVPGSHKLTVEEWLTKLPPGGKGQPEGAIALPAKAGSVLLFDRRLRHAATANYSDYTRKAYFVGYAYRWLKNQSGFTADVLPTVPCAVTRQLLNDNWSAQGWFSPTPADAPLFTWLTENGFDPATTGLEGQGMGSVSKLAAPAPANPLEVYTGAGGISATNYGRLQGDVGRQSWALFPGMEGGYAEEPALPRDALQRMSKQQLVDLALRLQLSK